MTTTQRYELIDVSQIREREGANPRTWIDDERLAELAESIISQGVAQPITVTSADGGGYEIVAGHRRLLASRIAKQPTIPAIVRDDLTDDQRFHVALVENIQREDLDPIDEARAYQRAMKDGNLTQAKLAKLVGKPASRIGDRLKLLKLPEQVQKYVIDGRLPLAATTPLLQLLGQKATNVDKIVTVCAQLVAEGEAEVDELIDQPHVIVGDVSGLEMPEWDVPFVCAGRSHASQIPLRGHVTDEEIELLAARAQSVETWRVRLTDEDVDAARSYGCLLEVTPSFGQPYTFITDAQFVHDRIVQLLDKLEAAQPDTVGNIDVVAITGDDPTDTPTDGKDSAQSRSAHAARELERRERKAQEAKRAQREAADKQRIDAIHANRQFGLTLQKSFGSAKPDRRNLTLLAELVLAQNPELASRGIRYTHETFHTLTETRRTDGSIRTIFKPSEPKEAHAQLVEWMLRPTNAEEILGRLLQALGAATFADQHAVAQSHRRDWSLPYSQKDRILGLIAQRFKRVLPTHFHPIAEALLPDPKPATPKNKEAKKSTAKPKTKTTSKSAASKPATKAKKPKVTGKAKATTGKRTPTKAAPTAKTATSANSDQKGQDDA